MNSCYFTTRSPQTSVFWLLSNFSTSFPHLNEDTINYLVVLFNYISKPLQVMISINCFDIVLICNAQSSVAVLSKPNMY